LWCQELDDQGYTNQEPENLEDRQEKKRFEETVEKALTDQGKTFVGLSITEKLTCLDDIMYTNEESTNGEFNVDFGKFFKKQATNLDVTIFEET
jgi:hypothetical protein